MHEKENTPHSTPEIMNQECMLYYHHQHALLEIAGKGGSEIQNVVATNKKEGEQ